MPHQPPCNVLTEVKFPCVCLQSKMSLALLAPTVCNSCRCRADPVLRMWRNSSSVSNMQLFNYLYQTHSPQLLNTHPLICINHITLDLYQPHNSVLTASTTLLFIRINHTALCINHTPLHPY